MFEFMTVRELYEICRADNAVETDNVEYVELEGWVRTNRDSGKLGFIALNDGSYFRNCQVVYLEEKLKNFDEVSHIATGSAIHVLGKLKLTPDAKQPFEVEATEIILEGDCDSDYPLQKKRHSFEFMREIPHLRPRANSFYAIFRLIVIAAFADMVAGTFNGFSAEGVKLAPNASAASISILYVFVAMAFGLLLRKVNLEGWPKVVLGIVLIVAMLAVGIKFPVYATKQTWIYLVFVYIFFASVTPMWLLKSPRDYLTTFLFIGMIAAAVVGVFMSNPTVTVPAFTGFKSATGSYLFPTLFVTIACGAVSGFHSLVSSETSSKMVKNEKDMLQVGYGSMLLESLLAVLVIVIVGSLPNLKQTGVLDTALANMALADTATPFTKFSAGVTGLVAQLGLPQSWGLCIMTMFVSALALTSLDAVARISRMSFQEFFEVEEGETPSQLVSVLTNKYVSTLISLFFGYLLSLGGYVNIWPLFGSANQLLAAMVLVSLAVFLKVTGRKGFMLYVPMVLMFIVTMTALVQAIYAIVMKLFVTGGFMIMTDGLQLVVAVLLVALGLMITFHSTGKLVNSKAE